MEENETLNVDKIIGLTFRSIDTNVVNFKMLQTILLILAHRMGMLEQAVDIREETYEMQLKYSDSSLESEDEKKTAIRTTSGGLSTPDKAKYEMDVKGEDKKEKGARNKSDDQLAKTSKESTKKKVSKAIKASDHSSDVVEATSVESKYDKEISVKMSKDKSKTKLKKSKMADDAQDLKKEEYGGEAKSSNEDKGIQSRAGIAVSATAHVEPHIKKSKDTASVDTSKAVKASKDAAKASKDAAKASKDAPVVVDSGTLRSRTASIELVTRSQFALLEMDVEKLMKQAGPVPMPSMPDIEQIKEALSKGTTTLPGSMGAVQLNARVTAAEQALVRMSDLLKKLADSGALPPEMAALVNQLDEDYQNLKSLTPAGKRDFKSGMPESQKPVGQKGKSQMDRAQDAGKQTTDKMPPNPLVTRNVLSEAVNNLKDEIAKKVTNMTNNSTMEAANAANLVKSMEGQLVIALAISDHIKNLELLTAKNAKQLNGLDSGLRALVQNFEKQVRELKDNQKNMAMVFNMENTAVTELQTNQEKMKLQVDQTLSNLKILFTMFRNLNEEAFVLLKWLEMVFDEKMDQEELVNKLKQKLDMNKLDGLLREDVFEANRQDLYKQIESCSETFEKKNTEWLTILKNLWHEISTKLPLLELGSMKDFATSTLREIKETLRRLDVMMGDPKVALLTRQLARNAYCASCMIAAQMDPFDKTSGMPPRLPELTLQHFLKAEEEPILKLRPLDERKYICKRWVGGSHTIITEHKVQEKMPLSELQQKPVKYFTATADDGRIYMMQEDLEPCIQCYLVSPDIKTKHHPSTRDVGAGDHAPNNEQSPSNEEEYIQELASIMSTGHGGSSRFGLY